MKRISGIATTVAIVLALPLIVVPARADHPGTSVAGASTPVHSDSGTDQHHMTGTGAVYLLIGNEGDVADRLLGGTTEVADVVEIHETAEASGVMRMRSLANGLEVPAGGETVLAPRGYHIMLIGLTKSLQPGTSYDLILIFERAGEVTVPVVVQPMAPAGDEAPIVVADNLTITGAWSRPAPMLTGGIPAATPAATPAA